LTRHCLSQVLAQNWPGAEISVLGEPLEALKDVRLCRGADLVLLNLGAAHATAPLPRSIIRRLVGRFGRVPVVVFGDHEDIEDVVQTIQLGARGYIPTSQDLVGVAEALRFISAGGTFVPASSLIKCAPQLTAEPRGNGRACDRLTPREMEVLVRLRQGMPNKGIAHELEISESTVKVFVRRILAKLHAVNRTEVAYLTQHQFEDLTADSV
jgi:DNA-binding NarL/FixJ family response regulator